MEMKETRQPDNMKPAMGGKHHTPEQCAASSNERANDTQ